jgi:hypothetical protein
LGTVASPDTTYLDNSIETNSDYFYAATAVDNEGHESYFSNIFELQTSSATPVELAIFTGKAHNNTISLEWATKTETNNYGFEIEKSINKVAWEAIGFVQGHGTSTSPQSYSFIDQSVTSGEYYYRLKQVDLNSSYKYSEIISVGITAPISFKLNQNYPNPCNPSTTISYTLPQSSHVELIVYNTIGQMVNSLVNTYQEAGSYSVQWNGDSSAGLSVPSGIYYYKIETSFGTKLKRMTLIK